MRSGCVTVTVKLHVFVLLQASTAPHVISVVPTAKKPEGADQVTGTLPSQASVAVTVKFTTAPPCPDGAGTTMFVGQFITGGLVSMSVMLWLHVELLLAQSVACHVRVMTRGHVPFV